MKRKKGSKESREKVGKGYGSRGRGRDPRELLRKRILRGLKAEARPLFMREIIRVAGLHGEEKHLAKELVEELVSKGDLVHLKGNRFGLCSLMPLVSGHITIHPDGFGFVRPDKGDGPDIFIPRRGLKGAIHGDKVLVRVEKRRRKGPEGSVVRIVERSLDCVVGIFSSSKRFSVVIPEDERLLFEVIIPKRFTMGARTGQAVVASIDSFPERAMNPEGRIIEVLGDPDDISVQTSIVIEKQRLPHHFSKQTEEQTAGLPTKIRLGDLKGRKDIRDLPLVTIDGEQARDFDDAVFVKKTRSGYILTVAIADVSHYVTGGTPIDDDAMARGTSVYFPSAVIPMLPEVLSNGLCSLVPDQDRLAMCARITYDLKGQLKRTTFFKAVMRNHRRFTYTEVKKILVDRDPELVEREKGWLQHLEWMKELALLLHKERSERGSIDFDLPEPQVIIGLTGDLEEIVRRERNVAHQIIEEFMIAANEAVAAYLEDRQIPTLYRVHDLPDPDKVEDFVKFAATLGINLSVPKRVDARWFQKVLSMVEGKPHEYVVNTMLLRTMKQAVYAPENIGHFGLASPKYLHFTSPIRRYPDLIVHRILKGNLRGVRKRPVYTFEQLKSLGEHCSARERVAMEAEREVLDRLKARFMADRIGEEFDGVISGVTGFGFFVELKEMFIDGAVRLVDMADDYYELDQAGQRLVGKRRGKVYRIGQEVRIRVKDVSVARRHITFELVEEGAAGSPGGSGHNRKRRG